MGIFTNEYFYYAILIAFILMGYTPRGIARTSWFGLINMVALYLILGIKILIASSFIALFLWGSLNLYQSAKKNHFSIYSNIFIIIIYSSIILIFITYKSILDDSNIIGFSAEYIKSNKITNNIYLLLLATSFSYVFLRTIDLISSIRQGQKLISPLGLSGYLFPFFMLPAGPIATYNDHISIDSTYREALTLKALVDHLSTITSGLFLSIVCTKVLKLTVAGPQDTLPINSILDAGIFLVYMYLEFSGYSLVASGIGSLVGVPTPKNFNKPFLSRNVTDFWARWHISLGNLVKRHIFIPLQVNIVRRYGINYAYLANMIAVILSFTFTGLWHRTSFSLLIWGLLNGLIVALEKVISNKTKRMPILQSKVYRYFSNIILPVYVFMVIASTLYIALKDMLQR